MVSLSGSVRLHAWSCTYQQRAAGGASQVHVWHRPTAQQVLSEYKVEEEAKGGRPEAAMPGFTTMFWRRLMNTQPGLDHLSEWAVLAELALVMVPGSVEAERMFSTMSFLNTQGAEPADHTQEALKHWHAAAEIRGRYGLSSNTY